ncbi:MAG: glycosyltransferase family 2 protein [Endomicrobium sp.]|jgi:glycosyltransferase involved in cell wall biosynthesis|nr:glycosyltransferase family 2 protein [Endomicrobium sp.]
MDKKNIHSTNCGVSLSCLPLISVIIPVYNTESYLRECLDSVVNQTFKGIEIICVNDGSPDNSKSILEEYAKKDNRIHLIDQKNQGVVTARNNGIEVAKGKYIYCLDSDDKIAINALEILYNFAKKNPKYAVVTCQAMKFGIEQGLVVLPKPTTVNMYKCNCVVSTLGLYEKRFWQKYGGYDTRFNDGIEDYDFWMNFINDGQKIIKLSKVLFYYRIKNKNESRNEQTKINHGRLCELIHQKYPNIEKQINKTKFTYYISLITVDKNDYKLKIKLFKIFPLYTIKHKNGYVIHKLLGFIPVLLVTRG